MAQLLYRLGLGAARRPFTVLIAWLLALALAVGGFLAFGGTLSTAVDIPGTPTAQVTDRLKEEFPDASHGTGQVVFATEDGSAPQGATIKGNASSKKYHVPGSRWYDQTAAEVWFTTVAEAEAAGFEPAGGPAAQKMADSE